MFTKRTAPFAAFVMAALLGIGVLAGCQNANQPTTPTVTQQNQSQYPAAIQHAINVQNNHAADLMKIPGVNGTGVGLAADGTTPVVVVFTSAENVSGIPAKVEDVATDVRYIGVVTAYAHPGKGGGNGGSGGGSGSTYSAPFGSTYRTPMFSGVSTGNEGMCEAGTISCVIDATNNVSGSVARYLLSNNHVFALENTAPIPSNIDQPGLYDSQCSATGAIATLAYFHTIDFTTGNTNTVDCALAELPANSPATSTVINDTYTPTNSIVAPNVGDAVEKTGRTTGLTTGTIQAINVTVSVQYSAGNVATFTGQIEVSGKGQFSKAGDSGSLIVENNGTTTVNPVGLLFAGGQNVTFANQMSDVMNDLQTNFGNKNGNTISIESVPYK